MLPVLYWIPSFFWTDSNQVADHAGTLLGGLINLFNSNFRILCSFIALLLIMLNAYLLIQLNTIHIFIPVRTQLPALFYMVLVLGMTQLHQLTPALVASSLLIIVFYRILNSYKEDGISINFLDAGLLISLASLVYFPSILFFLFLLAALAIMRPFIWREWAFALLGLILPYLFVFSGYYLYDKPVSQFFQHMSEAFTRTKPAYHLSQIINWSWLLVFLIISSFFMVRAFDSMKIHARKFFAIFLVFFLLSVLVFLLVPGAGTGMVYFVSLPLAYLFSFYFTKCKRNFINEVFFALFMLLWLWQRIN